MSVLIATQKPNEMKFITLKALNQFTQNSFKLVVIQNHQALQIQNLVNNNVIVHTISMKETIAQNKLY